MRKLRRKTIQDYDLYDNAGRRVKLSLLFGRHKYLVILHNMGKHCPNCALWGDEFNGMRKHLERAFGFAIVGPDDPKMQKAYVKERGWKVRLYSAQGSSFIKDMGFESISGSPEPGISIFKKERNGKITIEKQCQVGRDGRAPSVLEVFWMTPDVEIESI